MNNENRWEISYEKLKKSINRLKEQYKNLLLLDQKNISDLDKEAIKESVVHRFKICYDSFFKALKKHLQKSVVHADTGSPRAILRKARDMGVMDQEALANWFSYIDLRIGTTHDYSKIKAEKALSKMGEFIEDVEDIYKVLDEKEHNK